MTVTIAFAVRPHDGDGPIEVVPVVGDTEFTNCVREFECRAGMEPSGGYGGLVPAYFRFEPASHHYLAAEGARVDEHGKVPVLGCECGEWGCWPLLAGIVADESTVTWTDFEQPHRKERDYSAFGPFVFDRQAYVSAVDGIARRWGTDTNR